MKALETKNETSGMDVVCSSERFGEVILRVNEPIRTMVSYSGGASGIFGFLEGRHLAPTPEERDRFDQKLQKNGPERTFDNIKHHASVDIPFIELLGRTILWIAQTDGGLYLYDSKDNLFFLSGRVQRSEPFLVTSMPLIRREFVAGYVEIQLSGVFSVKCVSSGCRLRIE